MTRPLALLLLLAVQLPGQDLQPREVVGEGAVEVVFEPAPEVHGWEADESPVLLDELRSLEVRVEGVGGMPPTGGEPVRLAGLGVGGQDALRRELGEWVGRPLTEVGLDRLTEVILRHYEEHDRPVNDVFVPPQDGAGGHLVIEVGEGRIGQVGVSRSRYFSDELLQRGVHLRPGDVLKGSSLYRSLDWLSRNPFRQAELFASPGEGVSADLIIGLRERRPWRVYAGYDNTGSEAVGENRWFAGVNWANGFGLDHVLGYQFTVGDSIDDFHAHSLTWEIPLHRRHQFVRAEAAWADVTAVEVIDGMVSESEGESWQVGLFYGGTLSRWGNWRQEWRAGVEFKRADNFALLGDLIIPGTKVDILQVRGEWEVSGPLAGGRARLVASLVASPGNLGGNNGDEEFEAFRSGADPTYLYGRLDGRWSRELPANARLEVRGAAQLASGALLPTEQLQLGGAATIRGYDERILLGDGGYHLSAELYSPALPVLRKVAKDGADLRGLLFLDHGLGWREGEGSETLSGAGVGARLDIGTSLSGRLDLGWGLEGGDGALLHAGLLVAF